MKFAREHGGWNVEQWKRVVWSDESPFRLQNQSTQYVWRTNNEQDGTRSMQGTVKHQKSINVWRCFSWNGIGDLHRVKGTMTGEVYRKILIHHLVPSANRLCPDGFIFQHDNDPKHTSGVVTKYLKNKKINVMASTITRFKSYRKFMGWTKSINNTAKTKEWRWTFEILKNGWQTIPLEYLHRLIESMPSRWKAVIKSKGMPTKY